MDNVGFLLHKLTKYQTLLANVNDAKKKNVYKQKIAFYNDKMTQLGVDQQNLNNLNNLVGGDYDKEIVGKVQTITNTLLAKLAQTPSEESAEEKKNSEAITKQINDASEKIDQITKSYANIIDTLKKVIDDITQIDETQIHTGKCVPLEGIITELTALNSKLENVVDEQNTKLKGIKDKSYADATKRRSVSKPKEAKPKEATPKAAPKAAPAAATAAAPAAATASATASAHQHHQHKGH